MLLLLNVSMAYLRNKKDCETGLLFSQSLSFKACKMFITARFTHLVWKLYKNVNLRCSFKASADAADKRKYTKS